MRRRVRQQEKDRFEHAYNVLHETLVARLPRFGVELPAEVATELLDELCHGQPHLLQDLADSGGTRWWYETKEMSYPLGFPWFKYYPEGDEYGNNVINIRMPRKATLNLVTNLRVKKRLRNMHVEDDKEDDRP